MEETIRPRIIIGLGNPGAKFKQTRHNVGFMVVDELAKRYGGTWKEKTDMHLADIMIDGHGVQLVKPQTFMNDSGRVIRHFSRDGITAPQIIVVHDELEISFGKVKTRQGGSARGHNGLRSLIQATGANFFRIRCGIGRPEERAHVGDYVLSNFSEPEFDIMHMVNNAANTVEEIIRKN